jgi:hemin uptake protein HemP
MKQRILNKPAKLAQSGRSASNAAALGATADSSAGIASNELLGPRDELKIRHNGELYSLRKTRFNKLILTK